MLFLQYYCPEVDLFLETCSYTFCIQSVNNPYTIWAGTTLLKLAHLLPIFGPQKHPLKARQNGEDVLLCRPEWNLGLSKVCTQKLSQNPTFVYKLVSLSVCYRQFCRQSQCQVQGRTGFVKEDAYPSKINGKA